jgi:hypothetical protein
VKQYWVGVKENQVKIWILLALWSSITLWSSGHPFGGSADEGPYLQYGIEITASAVDGNVDNVSMAELLNTSCFKYKPSISALCQDDFQRSQVDSQKEIPISIGNYPKPWFFLTAFPAYLDQSMEGFDKSKILAGQLAFLVIAVPVLMWRKSIEILIGIMAFCIPPLSLHMLGSYNSNGMEIAATVGVVLLLLNLDELQSASSYRYKWWITFVAVLFLASTAKPMSGVLLFVIIALIILVFKFQQVVSYKDLLSVFKLKADEALVLVLALVFLVISYVLTIPGVSAGEQLFGPDQRQSDIRIVLTHLLYADKLFTEFAGFFGWRDTYPAPFGMLLWISSITIFLFFYFKDNSKKNKLLGVVFLMTIVFLAPIVLSLALERRYDVGIQMRYLGGLYATIFSLLVFLTRNVSASKWVLFYRLNLILYLVNFCWVYVRFSVGQALGEGNGKETFLALLRGDSWVPQYPLLAIFSGLLLLSVILFPVRNMKSCQSSNQT